MNAIPDLSAVLVVGGQRRRASRSLRHLLEQTVIDRMEVVVVDLSPHLSAIQGADHSRVRYFARPEIEFYSDAVAAGIRQSRGGVIAMVEDHCFVASQWAQALLRAYEQPVSVVNYTFIDAEPSTYLTRSFLFTEYGRWMAPARPGPIRIASCNNISYRRSTLEPFWERLEGWFQLEWRMHHEIRSRGGVLWLEPDALAMHEDWTGFAAGCRANGIMKRMLAGCQAETENWPWTRRWFYCFAMAAAPALHIGRLAKSVWNRPPLWWVLVSSLPISVAVFVYSSWHEALGYILGPGRSRAQFLAMELVEKRSS